MGRITSVFFDVGQTLLLPALPEPVAFFEEAARSGVVIDLALIEACIPRMYEYYEEFYEQDNSFWADDERAVAIWIEMYGYLCSLLGIDAAKGGEISRNVHRRYFDAESWKPFDDVFPTLERLKSQGICMGLISNWDSTLAGIIEGLGLAPYFEVMLISATERLHKPMPEMFLRALERMGVTPSEAMHVGDHLIADVEGSRAVGMTPVFLERRGIMLSPPNTFAISTLAELPEILRQLD